MIANVGMSGDQQSGHALGCPTAAEIRWQRTGSMEDVAITWRCVLIETYQKNWRNLVHFSSLLLTSPHFSSLLLTPGLGGFFKVVAMVCMKLLPQPTPALFPTCWLYPFEFWVSLPEFQTLEGITLFGHVPISVDLIWLVHS